MRKGRARRTLRLLTGALLMAALPACQIAMPGSQTQTDDDFRLAVPRQPSGNSKALRDYYARVLDDHLTRGLLRQDGGGPDTVFSADDLARNFEKIAFYDEYARGAGLKKASATAGALGRWRRPVRVTVEFGDRVPLDQRLRDKATVQSYTARLSRVTGHPISMTSAGGRGNFHVLFMGEDDRAHAVTRIKQLEPGIHDATLDVVRNLSRSDYCLVIAFSSPGNDDEYVSAIALIRDENPGILRKACIHEEIAQGLGLTNDSPRARPSIFNDDDEFALLTTHDEMLLAMLYDNRLSIGISAEQARPIVRQMAREQLGATN